MSEAQKTFQASVRAFAESFIEPEAREYDEKDLFPREYVFAKMGREGYLGLTVPPHYGGKGLGAVEYGIFCEEVAKASAAYIHNGLPD